MNRAAGLHQLCRILQAHPPRDPDWRAVLQVANLALITPRLQAFLPAANAPEDVSAFVEEVARRNQDRNARLYTLMCEAASALNAAGVTPVVLKGAACLARSGGRSARMISDVDMVVPPEQLGEALGALQMAGFEPLTGDEELGDHTAAVLERASDPGQLDLHHRPPGPPSLLARVELFSSGLLRSVEGARLRTPDPHTHIYLQALHDQFHDGGYWRGGFDLRHAWDIADLIDGPEPIDWVALARLAPTRLAAQVVGVQLEVCRRLTGAKPSFKECGWAVQVQARRQWLQYSLPALRAPLAALAIACDARKLARHRRATRADRMAQASAEQRGMVYYSGRIMQLLRTNVGGRL